MIVRSTTMEKTNNSNPNSGIKKKRNQFEFCKVCKLNHDQGRRHNFFPNHTKSLSSFLSRFQSKLSDVRFFLKNPSLLRPEHASLNRFWCVFCDSDINELNSLFACGNAINHLASVNHLKSLKDFLWKYGGGMDRVDTFRISEADLSKWEKKCKSLKNEAANERSHGPIIGPLNDIHNALNSANLANFDKNNSIQCLNSSFSNSVVPLQNHTNEKYQVSHSELSRAKEVRPLVHGADSHTGAQFGTNPWGTKDITDYVDNQQFIVPNNKTDSYLNNGLMYQVIQDEITANGEGSSQGLLNLSRISSIPCEEAKGNVHSGGPPPWFDLTEGKQLDNIPKPGKSSKLNPKRVGAAWAERRKIELEMEKRGELGKPKFDANWLPNFGRVWQSGSRKESRKEFVVETNTSHKVESRAEMQLQPYVSKRMCREASN